MKKKYQVFISSTFTDLKEERAYVATYLQKLNAIPAGMEYFSARPSEQFEHIKQVIDEVDYYILIVGNRYGTISESSGLSYTELEYNYAVEKKIPIIIFSKTFEPGNEFDQNESQIQHQKLTEFRKKIGQGTLMSLFNDLAKLGQELACLPRVLEDIPRPGWLRDSDDIQQKVKLLNSQKNALERENVALKAQLEEYQKLKDFNPDEEILIEGEHGIPYTPHFQDFTLTLPMADLLILWGPGLVTSTSYNRARDGLGEALKSYKTGFLEKVLVSQPCINKIKFKLFASGMLLIEECPNEKGNMPLESLKLSELGIKFIAENA